MTSRKEEIEKAALEAKSKHIGYGDTVAYAFIDGANWADKHPSDEVLCRFIQLYKEWFTNQNIEYTPLEYIKKYWDGNERNKCANNSHRATKLSDINNDPRGYDKEGGEQ